MFLHICQHFISCLIFGNHAVHLLHGTFHLPSWQRGLQVSHKTVTFILYNYVFNRTIAEDKCNLARQHGLDITYRYQNYLELADENQYDVALLIYGDLCPLNPAQRAVLLQNVRRALKPAGRFVLDVSTRECRKHHGWRGSSPGDFSCLDGASTATFTEFRLAVQNCPNWRALESGFWKPGPHLLLEGGFDYPEQSIWLDQAVVIEEDGKISVYRMWFQD
jgi:SAM-dependent methyltransferase